MTSKKRLILSYGILALLLAVLFAANLFWGSVSLTPGAVLAALTGRGQDAHGSPQPYFPAIGPQKPGHQLQAGGLAGAVAPLLLAYTEMIIQ